MPHSYSPALLTDLYQLTMMQAYWREGMTAPATFDLFVRRLPAERNVLLACGLGDALHYLERLRFSDADLHFLAEQPTFHADFLDYLREFRFTGSVRAVPEGTPVFHTEPLLEVTAPMPEAQLVETFVLNQVHLQSVVASKAARVVEAARELVEVSLAEAAKPLLRRVLQELLDHRFGGPQHMPRVLARIVTFAVGQRLRRRSLAADDAITRQHDYATFC